MTAFLCSPPAIYGRVQFWPWGSIKAKSLAVTASARPAFTPADAWLSCLWRSSAFPALPYWTMVRRREGVRYFTVFGRKGLG